MGRFKIPSWLQAPSPASAIGSDAGKKRHSRPSLSALSRHLRTKQDVATSSSNISKTDVDQSLKGDVSRLVALARKISAEAEKLESYLRDNGSPQPGFGVDAPGDFPNLPADLQQSRQQIVYATHELESLVRGPRESVRWGVWSVCRAI